MSIYIGMYDAGNASRVNFGTNLPRRSDSPGTARFREHDAAEVGAGKA